MIIAIIKAIKKAGVMEIIAIMKAIKKAGIMDIIAIMWSIIIEIINAKSSILTKNLVFLH